ncbi:MAG: helix-turn-helix transcriptional regulator [Sphingorhabdus sp.]
MSANAISSRIWDEQRADPAGQVATVELRPGMTLVMSNIVDAEECEFHHIQPEDVFGIGFHLKGGSRFNMTGARFETRPLDVWASAAPAGAGSTFIVPSVGFRTVAIRLDPIVAGDIFGRGIKDDAEVMIMIKNASVATTSRKLSPLDSRAAVVVNEMFDTDYVGGARLLYLESCALSLLAAQLDALTRVSDATEYAHPGLLIARDYLDAHLDAPPSLLELARIAGINDFRLKRDFKALFGTTVFGYVRQRLMERAAAKMQQGLSVSQASQDAGYACPRCFSDAFRRHLGVLPSELTRTSLANVPRLPG